MYYKVNYSRSPYLAHHGIKGQKWGIRRWQYENGRLTPEGKKHYGSIKRKIEITGTLGGAIGGAIGGVALASSVLGPVSAITAPVAAITAASGAAIGNYVGSFIGSLASLKYDDPKAAAKDFAKAVSKEKNISVDEAYEKYIDNDNAKKMRTSLSKEAQMKYVKLKDAYEIKKEQTKSFLNSNINDVDIFRNNQNIDDMDMHDIETINQMNIQNINMINQMNHINQINQMNHITTMHTMHMM